MSRRIGFTGSGIVSNNASSVISGAIEEMVKKLEGDISDILWNDSTSSPSGFLRKAYSKSSSTRVYYAPRKRNEGYPPRQNTLKDISNFSSYVQSSGGSKGFVIENEVKIDHGGRLKHKSEIGKTKGQAVYPWIWIDEGNTYRNRFTGNPRRINQTFTRDWHSQGYRGIFINKLGSQLRSRGWDVSK